MADISQISKVYVSLFNRAIDSSIAGKHKDATYDVAFIKSIIDANQSIRDLDNTQFVELIYKNALGKDRLSDEEGINFWVNALSSAGTNTKESLLYAFINDVNDYASNRKDPSLMTETAKAGLAVFNAKIAVSDAAANKVGSVTGEDLTFGAGLPMINAGNASTEQGNAIGKLDGIAMKNPANTPGGNEVTLGAGQNFTKPGPEATEEEIKNGATDASDTINVSSENLTAETVIDAAGAFDTLNVDLTGNVTTPGKISNVERISLNNGTDGRLEFNANKTKGVNIYDINGKNGVNISNISYNDNILINVNGLKSGANDLTTTIGFDTVQTGGSLSMSLNDVGYDSNDNGKSNQKFDLGKGIGQLSLQITGNNYADIVSEGVNRITLAGSGTLDTNLSKGVVYFDAQNATGDLKIRATETAAVGDNGNNIFEHFATGSGKDDVTIDVSRLDQNAKIDLGAGEDTLRLQGYMRKKDEKQYYNVSTVEHLAIGPVRTQDAGTGTDGVLLLDLGTGGTSDTANRSANLKKITIEHGGSTSIENLGSKNLDVIFNGANKSDGTLTKVTLDHSGTTNLVLQGDGDNEGAGFINVDYTKELNIDLTGQGFTGAVSAGDATKITISNRTTDKTLTLQASTETGDRADWTNVKTIDIDTSTQRAGITAVKLEQIDMPIVETINLRGIGDVEFRNLSNDTTGISINGGASFTGKLMTGNIYAGTQKVSIATKGAIQTGEITGSNVSIDLSGSKTASNDIGKITLLDGTGSNEGTGGTGGTATQSSSLTYKTGFAGTKGAGTKDTQGIEVVSKNATLNLYGRDGVDKFNVVASKFTTKLTINGNLGTSADDNVVVDLSETSGATLDISKLVVNNIYAYGVDIVASKGQDNITLSAGTDVVEFETGGAAGSNAKVETATITAPALGVGQSLTFFGVTLTREKLESTIDTDEKNATEVAKALLAVLQNGGKAGVGTESFKITGTADTAKFYELFNVWSIATATADAKGVITVNSNKKDNVQNLDELLKFTTNPDAATALAPDVTAGASGSSGTYAAPADATFTAASISNKTDTYTVKLEDADYKIAGGTVGDITISIGAGNTALTDANVAKIIADILGLKPTGSADATNATSISASFTITGGDKAGSYSATVATSNTPAITWQKDSASYSPDFALLEGATVSESNSQVSVTGSPSANIPDLITITGGGQGTKIASGTDGIPVTQAKLEIELKDLKAGQSYTIDGKTVTAKTDLKAADVAKAFTLKADDTSIAGAIITSTDTTNKGFDTASKHLGETGKFTLKAEGNKFIATQGTAEDNDMSAVKATIKGSDKVSNPTVKITQEGVTSDTFNADSYISLNPTQSGSVSGDNIKTDIFNLNDKNLDTLNKFDINNDKLNIAKFDEKTALHIGAFNSDNILKADKEGTQTDPILGLKQLMATKHYIIGITGGETSGGTTAPKEAVTLDATLDANGIVQFTANTATKGQLDNYDIKLEYKFAALQNIGHNQIAAFAHGSDVYVVAGGSDDTKTTDDVVVKLTGVATNGITALDLGNILA